MAFGYFIYRETHSRDLPEGYNLCREFVVFPYVLVSQA